MSSTKRKDSESFEKVITPENKILLERILDTIDSDSSLAAGRALEALNTLLGVPATTFLLNLLDSLDITGFLKGIELSKETQRYALYLFVKYGYKLRGLLLGDRLNKPHEWISVKHIATRFDLLTNELLLKVLCMVG